MVHVQLSPFSCHHFPLPHPPPPPTLNHLALSMGPLYMFLNHPFLNDLYYFILDNSKFLPRYYPGITCILFLPSKIWVKSIHYSWQNMVVQLAVASSGINGDTYPVMTLLVFHGPRIGKRGYSVVPCS